MSSDRVSQIIDEIRNNPDSELQDYSEEELEQAMNDLNTPYNTSLKTKPRWANLSVINTKQKYYERLIMTAMVGYLYRCYYDQRADQEDFDDDGRIMNFLRSCFQFDPSRHVDGFDRVRIQSEDVPAEKKELDTQKSAQIVYNCADKLKRRIQEIKGVCDDKSVDALNDVHMSLGDVMDDLTPVARPRMMQDMNSLDGAQLSKDVFYNFQRYYNNNYEQYRQLVEQIFAEKPDIENIVIFYDAFDSEDEALQHVRLNKNHFKYDVFTVSNNGATVLGPFEKNKERYDYYSSNTDIIKSIMEQQEQDYELGNQIMRNRVRSDKSKDIQESGLEPEELEEYKKYAGTVDKLGRKSELTRKEKEEYAEAQDELARLKSRNDENIVTFLYHDSDGNLKRTYRYTDVNDTDASKAAHIYKA